MRLTSTSFGRLLPFLAAAAAATLAPACASPSDEVPTASGESNNTSAGESAASARGDAGAAEGGVEVAPFTDADIDASQPKMRASIGGGEALDAAVTQLEIAISGTDRRFQLAGAFAAPEGKKVVIAQFGNGPRLVQVGTYDCSNATATVVVKQPDGSKLVTHGPGLQPRKCKVVVEQAKESMRTPSAVGHRVLGRIEAEVGPQAADDAGADGGASAEAGTTTTTTIRATFAALFIDSGAR